MASEIFIKIKCDPHLIKFMEKIYGPSPISFPKKSNFNCILDDFLRKPPFDYVEPDYGDHTLIIQLPYYDNKDIRSYNYLSTFFQEKFVKQIQNKFTITFRAEISKHIINGFLKKDALEIFMEKYEISQSSWDKLEKDFQRFQSIRAVRRLFRNNKSSADKALICPPKS